MTPGSSALRGRTLGAVLDEMTAANPSAPAVFFDGRVMSYAELRQRSIEAAKSLLALGLRRGDRLGVLLANEPRWLVMCYAASYVGATLVPLNTWYKKSELAWTLRHCEVSMLVTARKLLNQDYAGMLDELLPSLHEARNGALQDAGYPALRRVVMVGDALRGTMSWSAFKAASTGIDGATFEAAASAVQPTDAAFILYTSGSLAEPKGVVLNHGGVIRNGVHMGDRRAIKSEDRVWLGSPLFYGLGATNALPVALTHGASLVLQGSFEAGRAIQAVQSTGATTFYGTGNMTRAILDHPDYAQSKIGTLKKGNAGTMTEYKRMTLVEMGVSQASPAYGLTESYGNATVGEHDDPLEVKLNTSGRPLPDTELLIVDPASGSPLPAGQIGLVLLRGLTAPRYHANPEETRKAMRPDGYFDTGDLGSLDGDGRFAFHARLKEVIKSGGINVSPMEVEQLLVRHPHVLDAHVVGVADPVRGELIVAFVDVDAAVPEAELKDFVKERAASFKTPHHVFFRTESQLPRLASGKVAKFKLVEEARTELAITRSRLID
ncbi:AMP-binding protein [soil metagenome]